jgi:hypothetical protein
MLTQCEDLVRSPSAYNQEALFCFSIRTERAELAAGVDSVRDPLDRQIFSFRALRSFHSFGPEGNVVMRFLAVALRLAVLPVSPPAIAANQYARSDEKTTTHCAGAEAGCAEITQRAASKRYQKQLRYSSQHHCSPSRSNFGLPAEQRARVHMGFRKTG